MFRVSTAEKRLNLPDNTDMSELFKWLPHDNAIIVIKKVHEVSVDWGITELDLDKMKNLNLFTDEGFPIEYSIELMAQAVGLTGAAQSYLNISAVKKAEQVFVTGFKNLKFVTNKISTQRRVFVEILETKSVEGFKFCNCQIFHLISSDQSSSLIDFESAEREVLAEGILKAFIVYEK